MPEPEGEAGTQEPKSSKILDFFKPSVKETKKDKSKPLTKIVIRRLPPRLTKEDFLAEFSLPPHDYFYMVRGDLSMGVHSFSRVYVNLTSSSETFAFKEKYDDYELRDNQGKEHHAVVEWAPVQKVPKKSSQKKKMPKVATIESDPKYIEFLEKLEEEKNSQSNASEYFHETEPTTSKEEKITTTPLLEYIKLKRQKKIDMRNELRQKKRDAEKERRRKEEEMRKAEKSKKTKEEKDGKVRRPEGKDDEKSEDTEGSEIKETKSEIKICKEDVVTNATEVPEKKIETKIYRSDRNDSKPSRREERPGKRERMAGKTQETGHKAKEKGDAADPAKEKNDGEEKPAKSQPSRKSAQSDIRKAEAPRRVEPKSKFRYSEQRKDREVRSQKAEADSLGADIRAEGKEEKKTEKAAEVSKPGASSDSKKDEASSPPKEQTQKKLKEPGSGKDPRTERRIRNKDRPSLEIYRPGMGKFSKQRLEQKKDDGDSKTGSSKGSTGSPEPDEPIEKPLPSSSKDAPPEV